MKTLLYKPHRVIQPSSLDYKDHLKTLQANSECHMSTLLTDSYVLQLQSFQGEYLMSSIIKMHHNLC